MGKELKIKTNTEKLFVNCLASTRGFFNRTGSAPAEQASEGDTCSINTGESPRKAAPARSPREEDADVLILTGMNVPNFRVWEQMEGRGWRECIFLPPGERVEYDFSLTTAATQSLPLPWYFDSFNKCRVLGAWSPPAYPTAS